MVHLHFKKLDWTDRDVEMDTNPNPSFVGKKINNLTFYKNRLGILSRRKFNIYRKC